MISNEAFAKALRVAIKKRYTPGMIVRLAGLTGISRPYVSMILNPNTGRAPIPMLLQLAEALNIPVEVKVDGEVVK